MLQYTAFTIKYLKIDPQLRLISSSKLETETKQEKMKFVKIFVLFGMITAGSLSRKRRDLIGWNRGINNSVHNTSYYTDPKSDKKDVHFQYIAHMARNGLNQQQRELLRAHLAQYTTTVNQPKSHSHRFKHFTSRH